MCFARALTHQRTAIALVQDSLFHASIVRRAAADTHTAVWIVRGLQDATSAARRLMPRPSAVEMVQSFHTVTMTFQPKVRQQHRLRLPPIGVHLKNTHQRLLIVGGNLADQARCPPKPSVAIVTAMAMRLQIVPRQKAESDLIASTILTKAVHAIMTDLLHSINLKMIAKPTEARSV